MSKEKIGAQPSPENYSAYQENIEAAVKELNEIAEHAETIAILFSSAKEGLEELALAYQYAKEEKDKVAQDALLIKAAEALNNLLKFSEKLAQKEAWLERYIAQEQKREEFIDNRMKHFRPNSIN